VIGGAKTKNSEEGQGRKTAVLSPSQQKKEKDSGGPSGHGSPSLLTLPENRKKRTIPLLYIQFP